MHMIRTASRRKGVVDEVKIFPSYFLINQNTLSFELKFSAKEFGNSNAEYVYTMYADFSEMLNLINKSFEYSKQNLEQRNISNAKVFDKTVEAEVSKRMTEYLQSVSEGK